MLKRIGLAGLLVALAIALPVQAAEQSYGNYATRYYGSASSDNQLLFTTGETVKWDRCEVMSTAGAVDIEVTLDGTNFSTAALSLVDQGATALDNVLVTAAGRVYMLYGRFLAIRARQNGATASAASILCWRGSN